MSNKTTTVNTNREIIVSLTNDILCKAYDGRNATQQCSKAGNRSPASSEDPAVGNSLDQGKKSRV